MLSKSYNSSFAENKPRLIAPKNQESDPPSKNDTQITQFATQNSLNASQVIQKGFQPSTQQHEDQQTGGASKVQE